MNYRKLLSRTLCLILCVCFFVEVIPPEAYAVAVDAAEELLFEDTDSEGTVNLDKQNEDSSSSEQVGVLYELEDERSGRTKRFALEDGSVAAVSYAMDVNYLDENGIWQEIDNNFLYDASTNDDEDFTGLRTNKGSVEFKFADTTEENTLVRVTEENYQVDFTLSGDGMLQSKDSTIDSDAEEEAAADVSDNTPSEDSEQEEEADGEQEAADADNSTEDSSAEQENENGADNSAENTGTEAAQDIEERSEGNSLNTAATDAQQEAEGSLDNTTESTVPDAEGQEAQSAEGENEETGEKTDAVISELPEAQSGAVTSDDTTSSAQNDVAIVPVSVTKGAIISDLPDTAQASMELDEDQISEDEDPFAVENAHTVLTYEEVFPNVSLNYATVGSSLKESIIVSETADQYVYTFQMKLKNLTPQLGEDGIIYLNDSSSGKNVYYIPASYMVDANDEYSGEVTTTLSDAGEGQYIMTITADAEWINAEERAFPVMIDPSLEKSTADSDEFEIRDIYVVEGDPTSYSPYEGTMSYIGHGASDTTQTHRMFAEFRKLPELPAGSIITSAELYYYQHSYNPYTVTGTTEFALDTKEVTSNLDWTSGVTWETQPTFNDIVLDSTDVSDDTTGTYIGWNITSVIKGKYEDGNDDEYAAIAIVPDDEESISTKIMSAVVRLYKATRTTNKPYIVITYRDTYGVEDYYSCQSQEVGNAGNIYIGDYNSQMTLEETDYTNSSEAISFSLEHYYNSGLCQGQFGEVSAYTKDFSSMKMGQGWKLNAQQTVVEITLSDETYYVYTDGDGTEHYFSEDPDDAGTFIDEDDLGLSITKSGEDFTMTDGSTTTLFCAGFLTSMTDSSGNAIYFAYNGESYSASSTAWKPADSAHQLTSVVQVNTADSSPQTLVTLSYNSSNCLTRITDKAGNVTKYTYSNSDLTKITRPDNTTASYTYDASHYLLTATDNDTKYGVAYEWETLGCRVMVSNIKEYNSSSGSKVYGAEIKVDGSDLQHTVYTYCGSDRTFDTSDDQISTYTFDYAGRTVNVCTKNLSGTILGVETGSYGSKSATNSLTSSASVGQQAPNEILNGSGEYTSSATLNMGSWGDGTFLNGSSAACTTEKRHGKRSFSLSTTNASNSYARVYGKRTLKVGTYTFSAYIKTTDVTSFGTNGGASMKICTDSAGTSVVAQSEVVDYATSETADDGWVRVTGTLPVTAKKAYYIILELANAVGTAYYDDLQMEALSSVSQFNLIENGALITKSRWVMDTTGSSYTTEQKVYNSNALKIVGDLDEFRSISQKARIYQKVTNQSYVLSGWGMANSLPDASEDNFDESSCYFGLSARFVYSDGTYETQYVPFNTDVTDWQYASAVVTPTQKGKTLNTINIRCEYSYNANSAYFDCLSLTEEQTSLYDYDSKGNLISSAYGSSATTYTYDDDGNVLTATDENGNTTHFQYDEDGNLTGMSTNEFTVDEDENSTGTETTTSIVGEDGTTYSIGSTYTSDGNHIASETANTGAVTSYNYNSTTDYLTSVTDALGATTSYTYVSGNGNTASASLTDSDDNLVVSLNYTYSSGNLTALTRTGSRNSSALAQTFSFAYDGWNNLTSVSAGDYTLASYAYESGNGNLSGTTYGNGEQETYTYNNLDQITEISYNGTAAYKYTYTNDGNVETVTDVANDVVFHYRYDNGGNVIGFTKTDGGDSELDVVNWTSTDSFTTGSSVTFGGKTYSTSDTKDSQTGNVLTHKPIFGETITNTYDSLSQLKTRQNTIYQQSYTYKTVANADGGAETTGQIAGIDYSGCDSNSFEAFGFAYEYDLLGNITKISDASGNVLAQYVYDAQSQLIKETLPQQDKRYEYTYDTAGNLLTVKTFTATGTTATSTDTYTYGDSSWNDLLTAFNGSSISYDGAGNPLTYHNGSAWTFTWQKGRELASAVSSGNTLSFTYDADGIRSSKTVNGTKHSYLTLDGVIYRETWGDNTLIFGYDENGAPYSVNYNGTTYYYVLNQQGDVVRIVDASGETQASYTYDAWGSLIASTGTASGIGAVNPLLYRGYYYDAELGMYYLQSRYYDPVVRRFVNADDVEYLGADKEFVNYNLFAYCKNNSVNKTDQTGTFAMEVAGVVVALLVCSGIICFQLVKLCKALSPYISNLISIAGNKARKYVSIFVNELAQEFVRVKTKVSAKTRKNKTLHKHHIIPQKDLRGAWARNMWTNKFHYTIDNYRNTVYLKSFVHLSTHTNAYYTSLFGILWNGYARGGRSGFLNGLATIRNMLIRLNNACY